MTVVAIFPLLLGSIHLCFTSKHLFCPFSWSSSLHPSPATQQPVSPCKSLWRCYARECELLLHALWLVSCSTDLKYLSSEPGSVHFLYHDPFFLASRFLSRPYVLLTTIFFGHSGFSSPILGRHSTETEPTGSQIDGEEEIIFSTSVYLYIYMAAWKLS